MSGRSGIVTDTAKEARMMAKLYYTPKEVAEILAISDDAVLDLVNSGALPALLRVAGCLGRGEPGAVLVGEDHHHRHLLALAGIVERPGVRAHRAHLALTRSVRHEQAHLPALDDLMARHAVEVGQ